MGTLKLILLIPLFFFTESILGQYTAFDSVYTVASSGLYDYTNPTFEFKKNPLNEWSYLVYERHKAGGGSDIIAKKVKYTGYGPEFVLTNSITDQNINPVVLDSIVYWQSNKNGNWDIYYSWFNGTTWSTPIYFPGNTSLDEEQPHLVNTFLDNEGLKYLLVLKKGPDIYLHKLRTHGDTWDTTGVNITDTISAQCSYPMISDVNPYFIGFFKIANGEVSKFNLRKFNLSTSGGISWTGYFEMDTLITSSKIRPSYSFDQYAYFLFNKGTNVTGLYSFSQATTNLTANIPGSHAMGKGITMSYIFNSADNFPIIFSSFGCITKRADSNFISLSNNFQPGNTNNIKQKFLGIGAMAAQFDLSIPLSNSNFYKMRAVWENNINGKVALIESYAVNGITGINNQNFPVNYSLSQNYPNPFNPSTKINYEIKSTGLITLKVFDLIGKEVAQLVNEKQNAGSYVVDFSSTEFNLPSGIYFYTLSAGEFKVTKKMVLVK